MANVTKRKKVQKKLATTRASAEKKRLAAVQKKYGKAVKKDGVDTVIVRSSKKTRTKTQGGMKTKTTGRGDTISGKTGKVQGLKKKRK